MNAAGFQTVTRVHSKSFDVFAIFAGALIGTPLFAAIVGIVQFAS